MSAEPMQLLVQTTLVASFAALLMLLARRALRRVLGARAAYACWALLPVAAAAVLLPAPAAVPLATPITLPMMVAPAASSATASTWSWDLLLAAWLGGVMLMAAREAWRQRRFVRTLGTLQPRDGLLQASAAAGPLVLGLWRPRIVVPADFETRFDVEERALILAHERVHVARRDLGVNLLAVAIRCLQWFNPLLHLAFLRFREDQELAADAVVLQHRPEARRRYAAAMLKVQAGASSSPLGCQWQSVHPLKERILMLKRPIPGTRRMLLGASTALILTLSAGYAAWAAQPPPAAEVDEQATYHSLKPPKYPQAALDARAEGAVVLRVLITAAGEPEQVEIEQSSGTAELDQSAIDAVRTWKFNAARKGTSAAPAWVLVPITFSLDGPPPEAAQAAPNTLDRIDISAG